jgi:predicted RNA-binding Zn-ribbon protein involved in translation (DUF1610 family)
MVSYLTYVKIAILSVALIFIIVKIILYLKRFTRVNKCPNCGVKDSQRVERDLFTTIFLFFYKVQSYRCHKCWYRYYLRH